MRTLLTATVVALAITGCGDDEDERPAADRPKAAQEERKPSLDEVCAKAARDLRDPAAVARDLPDPPIPTSSDDPKVKREADELRGTQAVMQRIYDAATDPAHKTYREAVRALIQELSDAEVTLRQEYNVPESAGRLRTRWQRVERAAPDACRDVKG